MNKPLLILLAIVNIPLYGVFASVLFGREGITGTVRYLFIPDIISALRGNWVDDQWSTLMFWLWIILCGSLVYGEYTVIQRHFPSIFSFFKSITF